MAKVIKRKIWSIFVPEFWKIKIKRYIINRPYSIGDVIVAGLLLFFELDENQRRQILKQAVQKPSGGEEIQGEAAEKATE